MSSTERNLSGDLDAMELCRGIGSRPDSGFSDIVARSSTMGEVSDNSFQDSLLHSSSPYGSSSPFGRSSNQDTSRVWRTLQRPVVIAPTSSRSVMSANFLRAFRPRSAPLVLSEFSLMEDEDEDADDEISDPDPIIDNNHHRHQSEPSYNQAQLISTLKDHSPPPPAVFISRDRKRNREICRCLGGRQSSSRSSNIRQQLGSDTRSVATQTFIPPLLAACPRPTPHRRLFAAVRPQSAPLQEEEEEDCERGEGVESTQKETQVAYSWGAHQEPPSPTMTEAAGAAKDPTLDLQTCCRFCHSRSSFGHPHSPQESSRSSSVFVFGEEMLDLLDECASASSPWGRVQPPYINSPNGGGVVRSPDHEMLHEIAPFLECAQRPAFVRLRSASAPIEAKESDDAHRQLHRHNRRSSRRHSYNYENLVGIAQRMADAGDAFEMERRLFSESGRRTSSLQWLSSSLVDIVSRPIGALRDLWTSGSVNIRGEGEH